MLMDVGERELGRDQVIELERRLVRHREIDRERELG